MSDKPTIRPAEEADLPGIAALFRDGRDVTLLRWLLSDPEKPDHLRAWVAVDGDRIVGHCGYMTSRLSCGPSTTLTASAAIDWLVLPEYQGRGIGSPMMRLSNTPGDFTLIPGGTEFGQRGFVRLRYHRLPDLTYFVKILDPVRYVTRGGGRIRRLTKAAVIRIQSRPAAAHEPTPPCAISELQLDSYRETARPDGYIANVLPHAQLAWFLRCPVIEAKAYQVKVADEAEGVALCYMGTGGGVRSGRLTHLSYLGEFPAAWRAAVAGVEDVLRAQGCTMMSVIATHPAFVTALIDRGFVARSGIAMWFWDPQNVVPRLGWHLTAIESDLGHRGI
jgi:hypothetical protein